MKGKGRVDEGYDTYVCAMSCVKIPLVTEFVFKSYQRLGTCKGCIR